MTEDTRDYPTGCERHAKDAARIIALEEAVRVLGVEAYTHASSLALELGGSQFSYRTQISQAVYNNPIAFAAVEKARNAMKPNPHPTSDHAARAASIKWAKRQCWMEQPRHHSAGCNCPACLEGRIGFCAGWQACRRAAAKKRSKR